MGEACGADLRSEGADRGEPCLHPFRKVEPSEPVIDVGLGAGRPERRVSGPEAAGIAILLPGPDSLLNTCRIFSETERQRVSAAGRLDAVKFP
jgi:hypothetical protein